MTACESLETPLVLLCFVFLSVKTWAWRHSQMPKKRNTHAQTPLSEEQHTLSETLTQKNWAWSDHIHLYVQEGVDSHIMHIETGGPSRRPKQRHWKVRSPLEERAAAREPLSARGRLGSVVKNWDQLSQTLQSNRWLVLSSRPTVSLLLVSLKSS